MKFNLLTLNPIFVNFFGIEIRWYGVIITAGIVVAFLMSLREGKRRGLPEDTFYDILLLAVPLSLVGARLYYVVFDWKDYQDNLLSIFDIRQGGIAIYGGLITGLLVIYLYCRHQRLNMWQILDVVTPGVLLAQAIGRWGNFMNQEAHGEATSRAFLQSLHLPSFIIDQMRINGVYYQPTFLYESAWSLIGVVLILAFRHRRHLFKVGEIALSYVIWYSVGRFFVEGMRTDSLMLGPLRISQALALVLVVGSLILMILRRRNPSLKWYLE
ncbi:prolipoprotein diacylglyceryl transferase [Xylocopilactobacillus apicola]|uniref:Phosphatidylglycerol--prolipoprotein diacylglyceryl transferase n=1 Tax=Xylocopilactobacillus apicola TaxID=2932184 RepID=A0AAU9DM30_9LACO|nr:prolipoprotein diacylglyceryl transferase [Xylocopilactobacillus apicola]BDR57957.1 prolipoprotein diacylglyceryl transferase [Xylocopilactobacillus apicola]